MTLPKTNDNKTIKKPLILIPTGARVLSDIHYQLLAKKYSDPIVRFSDCVPLLVPTCYGYAQLEQYLDLADGVYLSGASTNIVPSLYGEENQTPDVLQDPDRDYFDAQLIPAALERGLPFLGVCRGHQELNISRGGTLYQKVHEVPNMMDHREKDSTAPNEIQYGPHHDVKLVPNTWFEKSLGVSEFWVNSLHGQGLKTLGKGLAPLAHAPDGLVEAMYCTDVNQFTLSMQWHPEWLTHENPLWIKIFEMYGDACRDFRAAHRSHRV